MTDIVVTLLRELNTDLGDDAADEIELLRSRIAELEVDRNEALNAAVDSSEIAGEACIKAHDATARAERLEALIRPIAQLAVMGDEKSDPRWKDAPKGDEDIIQVSISLGQLRAMRAALLLTPLAKTETTG